MTGGPAKDATSLLRTIAESISSASDPGLAEWQERGIVSPRRDDGPLVWGIVTGAIILGLSVAGMAFAIVVRPAIGLLPAAVQGGRGNNPALVIVVAVMAALALACGAAFAAFQLLSAAVYVSRRRK